MQLTKGIFLVAALVYLSVCNVVVGQEKELKFAITGAVASDPEFANYRQLSEYVARKIGRTALLVSGLSYNQVDNLFVDGMIDVGFICNCHYARRRDKVQFVPVAAPLIEGHAKPTFRIFVIVPKDSSAKSVADLKGKSVDFADPLSTTSCYAAELLRKKNQKVKNYFGKVIFSGSHDMTVELVAKKMVDAGFIDGHIWEYHNAVNPVNTSKTKIIAQSDEFTVPPVVVSKNTPDRIKKQIQSIFLNMHQDPDGRSILKKLRITKFVSISDEDYQSVRLMYRTVRDNL